MGLGCCSFTCLSTDPANKNTITMLSQTTRALTTTLKKVSKNGSVRTLAHKASKGNNNNKRLYGAGAGVTVAVLGMAYCDTFPDIKSTGSLVAKHVTRESGG